VPRIRVLIGVAILGVLVGIGYAFWSRVQPLPERDLPPAGVPSPSRQSIESALQLRAELKSGETLTAGSDPSVGVFLINTSPSVTHRVVKPGHGSEIGQREPHVTWSATVDRGDGKWVPVTDERQYGYCGTCLASSANWPRDVIWLAPGNRLELDIPQKYEFQQAGRVRLRAHYEYRASAKENDKRFRPEELAFMASVPAFKLESNPIEFIVVRPLDVRIRVKRPLKVGQNTRLSDLLDVSLVNQSREQVECSSPTLSADARVDIEIEGEFGGWRPSLTRQSATYGKTRTLNPGEEVPLLGPGEFANGMDGTWEYPVKGRVMLRAVYLPTTWKPGPSIRSEWVEIRVEE
jgi:hypothetical protein